MRTPKEIQAQWKKDLAMLRYHPVPGFPGYRMNGHGTTMNRHGTPEKRKVDSKGAYSNLRNSNGVMVRVRHANVLPIIFPNHEYVEVYKAEKKEVSPRVQPSRAGLPTKTDQSHIPKIDGELWRTIPQYEAYEVSDHGRVRRRVSGRFMTPQPNNTVMFTTNGKGVRRRVHHLVAEIWGEDNEFAKRK